MVENIYFLIAKIASSTELGKEKALGLFKFVLLKGYRKLKKLTLNYLRIRIFYVNTICKVFHSNARIG